MHCPSCQAIDTKVIESRVHFDGTVIRRRRKCEQCEKRFTTYEKYEIQMPVIVKNDGRRELYQRGKIHEGIEKACQKRPVSADKIDSIVNDIEKRILDTQEIEIATKQIGEFVISALYILDIVAYVRFAASYWKFEEINEFITGLSTVPSCLMTTNYAQEDSRNIGLNDI